MKNILTIQKLKELMIKSDDLIEPINYFFDMYEAGMLKGVELKKINPEVKTFLAMSAAGISEKLNKSVKVDKKMLYQLADEAFIHGACTVTSGPMMNLFYGLDIKVGIVFFSEDYINHHIIRVAVAAI